MASLDRDLQDLPASIDAPSALPAGWRPRAIAFDAFGTLVEIGDNHRPYHRFSSLARTTRDAVDPLVTDLSMAEWARSVGGEGTDLALAEAELAAEIASVRLRDWITSAWPRIRETGLPFAVCSNLATPYGPPLLAALPETPEAVVLSYQVGLRKPDPAIYALVARRLGVAPSGILFVGDTRTADYDGPRAAGMQALPVAAFEKTWPSVLGVTPRP